MGMAGVSSNVVQTWSGIRLDHARATDYFNGLVFERRVDTEVGDPSSAPLLYPVSLNVVKMLVLAMTNSFIGEMEDDEDAIVFSPIPSISASDKTKTVSDYCSRLIRISKGASFLVGAGSRP